MIQSTFYQDVFIILVHMSSSRLALALASRMVESEKGIELPSLFDKRKVAHLMLSH